MSEAEGAVVDHGEEAGTREVTDLVLQDILTGALPPGTWLKQADLERRYDCSRPEVRRALDRLAQKRLVEHVPNRGYHVFEPDGRQAREVADIRVMLETAIAPAIVEKATKADIARLRELAQTFDRMILAGTMLELYEANLAFHRHILSIGDNQELVNLISEIRHRTSSAPVSQWRTRARIDQSGREHHAMIDAIEHKSTDEFKRLVEMHIRQT